jgi:hypothetical protein
MYAGSDHVASIAKFDSDARQFIQQRYAGGTPANGCALIGPGNPLTPLTLTPLPAPSFAPVEPSTGVLSSVVPKHHKCRKRHHKGGQRKCRRKAKRLR